MNSRLAPILLVSVLLLPQSVALAQPHEGEYRFDSREDRVHTGRPTRRHIIIVDRPRQPISGEWEEVIIDGRRGPHPRNRSDEYRSHFDRDFGEGSRPGPERPSHFIDRDGLLREAAENLRRAGEHDLASNVESLRHRRRPEERRPSSEEEHRGWEDPRPTRNERGRDSELAGLIRGLQAQVDRLRQEVNELGAQVAKTRAQQDAGRDERDRTLITRLERLLQAKKDGRRIEKDEGHEDEDEEEAGKCGDEDGDDEDDDEDHEDRDEDDDHDADKDEEDSENAKNPGLEESSKNIL